MKNFDVIFKITILFVFGGISYFLYRSFQENLILQYKISQLESKTGISSCLDSPNQGLSDKNDSYQTNAKN